jgi:hypothetical protein
MNMKKLDKVTPRKHDAIPHGNKTVAAICGEKWPRLMSVRMAAAYTGRTSVDNFKKVPKFASLIKNCFGQDAVDRVELDKVLDQLNIQ